MHANVSLVVLKASDVFKMVIPSKIFESMAMSKPVILAVEGESREIVECSGAGICIEPENPTQLAQRVRELADRPTLCAELGERGRRFVTDHYSRQALASKYEAVLLDVVQTDSTASVRERALRR